MLKLLSLNIEGDNHLDLVTKLVRDENPDLISFNEVFEVDVPLFKHSFNMEGVYVPCETILEPNSFRLEPKGNLGTLILSKTPILSWRVDYYDGSAEVIPELTQSTPNAANRFLLWVETEKDGETYVVVNTHFTLTQLGAPSQLQRTNMNRILGFLNSKEFVLCGDFNAPRGGEIFALLADKYKDNIPKDVTTTIDKSIHRSGGGKEFPDFVVDGLFTSTTYRASEVRVVCGVSDHCAVLAQITHVSP